MSHKENVQSLSTCIGGELGKPYRHARMQAGWAKVFLSFHPTQINLSSPKIVLIASLTVLVNDVVSEHLLVYLASFHLCSN